MTDPQQLPRKRTRLVATSLAGLLLGIMCGLCGTLAIVLVRLAHVAVRLTGP